jgi:predicted ATPase/uncharacterized protein HemY
MAAPQLKVLVSSRALLHLYGEYDFAVPPMTLPDLSHLPPPGQMARYEAVRLFMERARFSKHDFTLAGDDAAAVAQICASLDGLPLAIELAAARVRDYSPRLILTKLENRLALLVGGPVDLPPRQRTLRGAIDWSYDLLDEGERKLFERLSVFVGGCTPQAAERILDFGFWILDSSDGEQIQNQLDFLVDKSILKHDGRVVDEPRYTMLETIREYASERLEASGEAGAVRRRFLEYYLDLSLTAHARLLKGPDQETWLQRLELEHDNLRAALGWAVEEGEGEVLLQMTGALWKFWLTHGHLSEGRRWLEIALRGSGGHSSAARAMALNGAGNLAHVCGDFEQAQTYYEEALAERRATGDKRGMASALNNLAIAAHSRGDYARVVALHQESLALKRELGDQWGIASTLGNLAIATHDQGDYTRARALHEESLEIRRSLGDRLGIALALGNLGVVALAEGRHSEARTLHEESLEIRRSLGDRPGIAESLLNLGIVVRSLGDYANARTLHQESLDISREVEDRSGVAASLLQLGYDAYGLREYKGATALMKESLSIFSDLRDKVGTARSLAALAGVLGASGHARRAAALYGATDSLLEATGFRLHPVDRIAYERDAEQVRKMLGDEDWSEVWQLGHDMTTERAVAYALE